MGWIVFAVVSLPIILAIVINRNKKRIKLLKNELEECRKDLNMLSCDYVDLNNRVEVLKSNLVK